jgi:hypothetical protein
VIDRLRKWFGASSSEPTGPPAIAVLLPSGDVLVFDRAGHALGKAEAPFEEVKDSIARDVGPAGQFFRIVGEQRVQWFEGSRDGSPDFAPQFEVVLTAIRCTVDGWLAGGVEGQPAGTAVFDVDRRRPFAFSPRDVWALIREAALRARR